MNFLQKETICVLYYFCHNQHKNCIFLFEYFRNNYIEVHLVKIFWLTEINYRKTVHIINLLAFLF